jgi:hypothetical protein
MGTTETVDETSVKLPVSREIVHVGTRTYLSGNPVYRDLGMMEAIQKVSEFKQFLHLHLAYLGGARGLWPALPSIACTHRC